MFNDEKHVEDDARLLDLVRRVEPGGRPHTRRAPGCVITTVWWRHWPCLFPQHGPGRKHERPIILEPWQQAIVTEHPGPFLRGLFHSDGARSTTGRAARSRAVEIPWRRSNRLIVSVSRREGVARLDALIGPKA